MRRRSPSPTLPLLLLLAAGCGAQDPAAPTTESRALTPVAPPAVSSPAPSQSPTEAAPDARGELLDNLRGLGYVGELDPETDVSLVGVVRYDHERVRPGYNLYADGDDQVFLIDMEGQRVHTWRLPENRERTTFAELLADDTLAVVSNYQLLTRLDQDSNILWELDLRAHHDVAQRPDGTLIVPYRQQELFNGRKVRFDGLAWVSLEGKILSRWYTFEHLAELAPHYEASRLDEPPAEGEAEKTPGERVPDYHHLNTIEVLPETELGRTDARFRAGNLLLCFRNLSTILILDQDTLGVTWSWGNDTLEGAHMPTMLPSGNILVYDNGVRRHFTRILELEPTSGRVVWKYEGKPPESFYSELRGSAQRLENGNTLVCEADRGHVIEVSPDGEILWEFWNPDIQEGGRKRIYRFMRYTPERLEHLLARGR